ncbi:solute carrier family 49 member A3 isoform X1 [Kryptolebias marmoratus]|uniref:solute carrier family 49 member A3 isoform X1 n=1 Tax=Kryptolebias marmoratus TaxID=37003 RepID=UPI0007F8BE74|nr:solute carrier family 49 member A3 isoform X1 [Kryptolebias marmoratus]
METTAEIRTVYGSVYGEPGRMNPPLFKVYRRRWFVLLVLCLLNCSNATIWLTFAPVAAQSAQFLQVSLEDINWLSVVFMVVAIPLSFGTTWLLDTFGLRITLVLGAWLNMFGALLRFLGTATLHGSDLVFPVVMLGQILGALAQPLIIFTPTKLAALWFPDHQRATANMFASMSNPVGILIANLVSPAIAKTPAQIPTLMQAYAVPTFIICFFASLGVLSSRPPTPPSAGAESSGSEPFVQGIKLLLRNKAYLVLLLCFGSGIAVFTCFTSLLEQILCVQGYSNKFAGVCGALFIGAGVLGAVPVGLYVDKTKKFMEVSKINMSLAAVACAGFSVVCLMRQQEAAIAAVCSLFGFFGFSVFPVVMELSVECSYPAGAVGGLRPRSSGSDQTARRLAAVDLRGRSLQLEAADDGDGGTELLLHLRLRPLLQHSLQTPGDGGASGVPSRRVLRDRPVRRCERLKSKQEHLTPVGVSEQNRSSVSVKRGFPVIIINFLHFLVLKGIPAGSLRFCRSQASEGQEIMFLLAKYPMNSYS